jgi:hypothetical protein
MDLIYIKIKLVFLTILGSLFGAIVYFFDYYRHVIIENKTFIVLIFSSFIADVILGMWAHLKKKDFSWSELFTKGLTKIGVSLLAMIMFNAIAGVEGVGESGIKVYLLLVGKLMNLFYITGSAFNNMFYITDKKFPPIAWMKRMKEFNTTLDTSKLTNSVNTNTTTQDVQ